MQTKIRKASELIFVGLLIYMPFHVLLATWIGSSFGVMTAAKILKDIVLVGGFLLALFASGKPSLVKLAKTKLVWLIAAYGLLTVGLSLVRPTEQDAEVLGIVYNLRFLLMFLYGGLIMLWQKNNKFLKKSLKVVLVAGLLVSVFGILQYLILPNDALSHLGYSKANGTSAAFFIDDKPNLERAMSTLKDPNSLGSYLLIIIGLSFAFLVRVKSKLRKRYAALVGVATLCLWFSFSRGALIGLIATIFVLFILEPTTRSLIKKHKTKIVISGVTILCIVTGGLMLFRDTYLVKNVIFHADSETVLEDPNELRLRFWRESLHKISQNPLGSGPGTAGIVSIRNQTQGVVLNENYYLQIAQEVGWLGIILFLSIIVMVVKKLWDLRELPVARGLLASLIGLLITSMLIHTWSNEAIAYTWWGLAGLGILGTKILKPYRRFTGRAED